ncbi:hypothetical protein KTO58_10180 [Chitinophaga pendula]|nr:MULTISPECIES: hypothetical protein [Chitinophaga]UCJ09530.1 hypothetical protein KTO58_10180 [Chitinophaga pendula]
MKDNLASLITLYSGKITDEQFVFDGKNYDEELGVEVDQVSHRKASA